MTVRDFIEKLKQLPMDADVMVESEIEPCDLCSHARGHKCSTAGKFTQFVDEPYLHEASNEARIRTY